MLNFLICLFISTILSISLSILFVEKGKEFPIKKIRIYIQNYLHKIYWKLPQMFYCSVCLGFWISILSDIIIGIVALCYGLLYFFWPFSGFIVSGITWILMEYLNNQSKTIEIINNIEK